MSVGVVLCGGQSSRMGQNKAELIYQGSPLKTHMKSVLLAGGVDKVYFSGPGGIEDKLSGLGPLSGLSSCLAQLDDESKVLFVPVDMPLLDSKLINELIQAADESEVTRFKGQHFPVMLKNTAKVRSIIRQQLKDKQLALHQLFKRLHEQLIESNIKIKHFTNVNTPDEWQALNNQTKKTK